MPDITLFRGRHSCVATFLDMAKSTLIASLPHPPNFYNQRMHDHPLRAHASSFLECLPSSPIFLNVYYERQSTLYNGLSITLLELSAIEGTFLERVSLTKNIR